MAGVTLSDGFQMLLLYSNCARKEQLSQLLPYVEDMAVMVVDHAYLEPQATSAGSLRRALQLLALGQPREVPTSFGRSCATAVGRSQRWRR